MSRLLMTAAVLAVLIYTMVLGVRWLTPRIESDIEARVTTSLAEQGLLWADVDVKGREVTLSGEAPSAESRDRALSATAKVFGVAKVQNLLTLPGEASATVAGVSKPKVAKSAEPYGLSITKDGDKVVIAGQVSSEADKAVLKRLADTHYGEGNVDVEAVEISAGAPGGWRTAAGTVLFNIVSMDNAVATLSDTEVMVSGTVLDQDFSDQVERAVRATLPEGYKVAFAVDVVTPTAIEPVAEVAADVSPAAGDTGGCGALNDAAKERLRFDFDKAQLKNEHKPVIERVGKGLKDCADEKMVVAGYTDTTGSPLYNKWLSQQRAEATLRGLMREGVDKKRLRAIGYGVDYPEASNETREGRMLNRRVEFHRGDKLPHPLKEAAKDEPRKAAKPAPVKKAEKKEEIKKPWWAQSEGAVSETTAPVAAEPAKKDGAWAGDH